MKIYAVTKQLSRRKDKKGWNTVRIIVAAETPNGASMKVSGVKAGVELACLEEVKRFNEQKEMNEKTISSNQVMICKDMVSLDYVLANEQQIKQASENIDKNRLKALKTATALLNELNFMYKALKLKEINVKTLESELKELKKTK